MEYCAVIIIGIIWMYLAFERYLAFRERKEVDKSYEWHFANVKKPIIGKYIENQEGHIAMYLGEDKYIDTEGNGINVTAWRYVNE